MKISHYFCAIWLGFLLSGCGGGSGGGGVAPSISQGPITSTLSFPLSAGLNYLRATGYSKSFTATSTSPYSSGCNSKGTAQISQGPANTQTTFSGIPSISAASVINVAFTSCSSGISTQTFFYYSDYSDMGVISGSGKKQVISPGFAIPNYVSVGSVGVIGTFTNFDTITSINANGREDITYVVEADTASTAIVNFIHKTYAHSYLDNMLFFTEQQRFRINASGIMTLISVDTQATSYGDVNVTRLLLN